MGLVAVDQQHLVASFCQRAANGTTQGARAYHCNLQDQSPGSVKADFGQAVVFRLFNQKIQYIANINIGGECMDLYNLDVKRCACSSCSTPQVA